MNEEQAAAVFHSMGDTTRISIIFLLHQKGPLNAGTIASNFTHISRPAISYHLKILKDVKVISATKKGQEVEYSLEKQWLIALLKETATQLEPSTALQQ
jgi:DNA-binding transcriptional ArsR family regulator